VRLSDTTTPPVTPGESPVSASGSIITD
jgi:hypothetical protein